MVKRKIIWSNRAKKRLYGILDFYITKNKSKTGSRDIYNLIRKELILLIKHPDLGLRTTEDSIYGYFIDELLLCYSYTDERIIIHTISDLK